MVHCRKDLSYTGKRSLCLILLICLAPALIFPFAFTANEALSHVDLETDRPSVFFTLTDHADHAPDWLAENTNTIRKANKHSPSPLRNGFFRVFVPLSIDTTAVSFVRAHYPLIKNDNTVIYKNNILLKLRT